ncbi:MAG: TolC family protein [Ignavibacteria bacterium]|jgi:outer membrane protein TolC
MKFKYFILFVAVSLSAGKIYPQALNNIIDEATSLSPEIKMLETKKETAISRIAQDSNLPDPVVTLGLLNLPVNSFAFDREAMTGKAIGISQQFPFPGKLGTIESLKEYDVKIIEQEIDETENRLRQKIINEYAGLVYSTKLMEILKQKKELLKVLSNVVGKNYSVSRSSQQDIFKLELERTALENSITEQQSVIEIKKAVLNNYLFRDSGSGFPVDKEEIVIGGLTFLDSVKSAAKENRPLLKQFALSKEKARKQEELAGYQFYPDFNVGVQYSQRDKIASTNTALNDVVTFKLGFNLPINYGGKKTAGTEGAKSLRLFFEQQYLKAMQLIDISIESSLLNMNSLKDRIKLLNDGLIPQAQKSYESSLANYQTGRTEFINVMESVNKLLDLQKEEYKMKLDLINEITNVEFQTGIKLIGTEIEVFKEN